MVTIKATYYTSIHKLKLSAFIDCLIDGNYSVLVIEGEPAPDELLEAWAKIYSDYLDALGTADPSFIRFLMLSRDLIRLQTKHNKIESLLTVLQEVYVAQFAAILRQLINKPLRFDISKPEAYKKDIKTCVGILKGMELRISIKESEVAAIQKENATEAKPMTRADFQATLVNLSDFAGYHISDQISTGEFCTRINLFNKHLQTKKK